MGEDDTLRHMPIRKLSPLLVNQIAAGEVIERPASVVKELVENSLDAGASRIDIAIEGGGQDLIRISDDGRGIDAEQLPLALAPHATSKLASAEQLAAIHTLGFRGEALASIASISRLRLSSRPAEGGSQGEAAVIEASGDQVSEVTPSATPGAAGTILEVRDLFFNTPARRKFMRSASTEFGHISDLVSRVAMVHPGVGFTLSHNGRTTLQLPPNQSSANRCIAILGKDLAEGLLEFEHAPMPGGSTGAGDSASSAGTATCVWGMAGLPSLARATGKFQYLCVNGRPIRDRSLSHAIKEAYRGLIPPDKHPMVVVLITLDPAAVDVNVHPTKAEVRFRHPSAVHGLVLSALRQRLLGADLTPSATTAASAWRVAEPSGAGSTASEGPSAATAASSPDDFVNYFRRMDPTQKSLVYQEVKRAIRDEPTLADTVEGSREDDAVRQDEPARFSAMEILQIHKSYVVTQDEEGLVIVDQHALHERVMFEELRRRVLGEGESATADGDSNGNGPGDGHGHGHGHGTASGRRLESQRLLMPAIIDADTRRQALLEELKPLLDRIGIEVEPLGPSAVGVQAFPSFLFDRNVEPVEFLGDLLDRAEEGDLRAGDATAEEAALHEVLDMMACKAAVKAGDKLTPAELAALLQKRHEIDRSSNCPHGRPTTLRLTLRDLEKQFGRS